MNLKSKAVLSKAVFFCAPLAALLWLPPVVSAQTLTLTNGVQIYASLTNTTVTMSNHCELRVTATNNPIPGCTINLNSSNAWFILSNLRPSLVSTTCLAQVFVNGAAAVVGGNCRVDEYVMGSVIVPQAPGFLPLQIFSGPNFLGASSQLGLYTYYTNTVLGALNRNIGSFHLKRGYSAAFAQNFDGTGASEVFVAQDGDLDVGILATSMNKPVSFVRVFPWRWTGKKGWVGGVSTDTTLEDPLWNYDYDNVVTSTLDIEYVPMRDTASWDAYSNINSKQGSTHAVGFNEPDQSNQADMTVAAAIAQWPSLMQSGLRIGAPAVSSSGVSGQGLSWLYSFMSQATNLGYRVDYIPVHLYQCSWTAAQVSNYLAGVYHTTGKPVWLTEFNDTDFSSGCNQTQSGEASAIGSYISMMESCPFVERYSVYEYFDPSTGLNLITTNTPAALTPAGQVYRSQQSTMAYTQTLPPGGSRSIAQFEFETNALDSSGYGNNALARGIPGYTAGHSGQAVALDGTNSYLQLPPGVASGSNFTFAAWVYWNGGANWQRIFDFGNDTSHYLFLTPSSGSGTLRFAIENGGGEQDVDTAVLPAGQWTHVAITLTNGSAIIYTNGVPAVSSGSVTIAPSAFKPGVNYLGKSQFPADPLFSGDLDEVQIADYAFTAAQIAALLTNQPPQFNTNFLVRGIAAPFTAFSTNVTGTATDPNPGSTLTYSKASGPAWLTVNADGTMNGTPGSGDGGTNDFTVRATDTAGASAFAVVSIIVPINYASGTWDINASGSWDDATKWSGAVIANGGNGANYTADFSTLNITSDTTVSLDSPRSIGNLKFGDTSGAQNWLLTFSGGNVLTLDTGSTTVPTIVVNQNIATLAAPLAGVNGFAKSGAGTLVLSNANSLSGTVYIDTSSTTTPEGIVRAASPGALLSVTNIQIRDNNNGSSTLQLDGSAGNTTSPAAIALDGRNVSVAAIENVSGTNTLSGGISINVGGGDYLLQSDAGTLVLGGVITCVATGNRFFTFQGGGDFLVSGAIQNGTATNGVIKTGAGTLTFAGANTYTNTTTVSGGTLLVNNTNSVSPVTVAGTATLGGRGVIRGPVTVQSGGTLAPGTNSAATGTLTVSNSVTLQAGSTTRMKISKTPQTNDVLRVAGTSGTLTYAGTLVVTNLAGTPAAGDSFKLFNATSYAGSFSASNLPPLSPGLAWSTAGLAGSGTLSVIVSDFGIAASPASDAVPVGGSATYTATVTATNFSGSVGLSAGGLPAGAGAGFSPASVTGSGAATLTVTVSNGVAAGNYPLTVTGTSGSLTHSATVTLSVNDFTVAATPSSQTLFAGGATNYTVNVGAVNGFAGTVTLSVGGLPAGAGWSLSQTNVTGSGAVTLNITTAELVPTNNYLLTVSGVSGGVTRPAQVTLAVQHLPADLLWNSTVAGDWDIATSASWLDTNTLAAALFYPGDTVRFDDTPGVVTGINLGAGVVVQPAAVTVAASTNDFTIGGAGKISGATGLVKCGGSTLTLGTTNDFTGDTLVQAGTLALAGGGSLDGSATIRVAAGALLDVSGRVDGTLTLGGGQTLKGDGAVNGSVAVNAGATLAPGNHSIGTLTISNSLTLAGTALIELNKSSPATNDAVWLGAASYGGLLTVTNLGGALADGDNFKIFYATNYSGSFAAFNLPPLGVGLAWNTNSLTNGSLSIIATLPPQFGAFAQTGDGNFQFNGTGSAGVTYELDAATNLPPVWIFVTNTVAGQNGQFQFSDLQATNYPQRFYRILGN